MKTDSADRYQMSPCFKWFAIGLLMSYAFPLTSCISPNREKNQIELKILQINLLRQTSYIQNGISSLASIIKETDPDIVLLSELDGPFENFFIRFTDSLKASGMNYYGTPTINSTGIISKFVIEKQQSCCLAERPITKAKIAIGSQTVVAYSAHLDYRYYDCYLPRGYSGSTYEKLDSPVTNIAEILASSRRSSRDEAISSFIDDASAEIEKGNLVLIGGDFNEPSHLDWQADTKDLRDHNGLVIDWDCSRMLSDFGMIDTYREIYPDPVKNPGFTFPSPNEAIEISKLVWAPDADERDRIDFIYYYPNEAWSLRKTSLVGPSETILYGTIVTNDSNDTFITPDCTWPTDHKGNLATFVFRQKELPRH